MVAEGAQAGALEHEERYMIERVLRLADKPVRALMTPRNDVAWIDRNAPPEQVVATLKAHTAPASWWPTGGSTTWWAWWRPRTCWTRS